MPAHQRAAAPTAIDENDAEARSHEDFGADLEKTGLVATDGAGGKVGTRSKRHTTVGAGSAVVSFNENREPIKEAMLVSKVPGNQTVPRPEAWAVSEVLQVDRRKTPLTIVTDATYVIKGFLDYNRCRYMKGSNADIWETYTKGWMS